ncbi:MAG TPA: FAD-binding oxidoreductase [Gammaproteobacteria bacterium]|jgi:glycine/D-amino acid oxidase-like deaminating enzyme|nr:FAD-binding oxidoreductase [Gammaproteobacteria bacterium]PHS06313.1 MAG: D-amino-acid oxidase [Acidithiobacillus sp.]RTZ63170.1 MAG: FAD-binding oxidoreductase [Gammaproteobacteria bacterium]HAD35685.1 FAD-binding oxidoreductase [Gammaproteobacteria bacterium]HBK76331.1 FAD-binding oxidoreductase [Gammaproteobacteria bacterium]|tara:strand:- start:857 stop:1951 length:1095 start_codon:yes stop_codon:yes gene_type:complete
MDVIIIGAGVIGSAIAYYLSRKGIGATVIERCDTACAASGKSGGFLARDWCVGQPQDQLAQLSFDLHTDLTDALATDYGYRRVDTYAMALSDRRSFARGTGLSTAVNWLNNEGVVHQLLGDTTTTAQLHPERFTRALLTAACTAGAQLRLGTVESIERDPVKNQVSGITVDGRFLSADAVVIAMGPWSLLATQWLPLPAIYGLKGYSITLSPNTPVTADALFLDYEDQLGERHGPELIPRADGEVYLCGFSGDDPLPVSPEDVSIDDTACNRLRVLAGRVSTVLAEATVVQHQACYRPICEDAMPVVGAIQGTRGAYVATGHNCWGMLNAPGTGLAMAELISDGQASSIDLAPFAPDRLPPLRQ